MQTTLYKQFSFSVFHKGYNLDFKNICVSLALKTIFNILLKSHLHDAMKNFLSFILLKHFLHCFFFYNEKLQNNYTPMSNKKNITRACYGWPTEEKILKGSL